MNKIAVYGAGSIGTVLGAFMARAGLPVDLICRNKAHVAALKENGAIIEGTTHFTIKVNALEPDEMTDTYDIIFLATKTIGNNETVEKLKTVLAPDGVLCTIQNGLPEYDIANIVGENRTLGCAIAWGAELVSPGHCKLTSAPDACTFSLGAITDNMSSKISAVKKLLETMGPVDADDNFIGARWSKLLINAAFSGLSAVTGNNFGEISDNKKSRLYAQYIIKECIAVGHANSVKFAKVQGKDIVKLLNFSTKIKRRISFAIIPIAIKKHRSITASMLHDLKKGKPCEIDAINGAVSKTGKRLGVPTPYNDAVVSIVKRIEKGELMPSTKNLDELAHIVPALYFFK
ncbi:MAG: 2-dehydropantoate 2-reductase [Christensenellaceae bacterium]|jgi:2-dehydropantoate 2-reductase|nr:2-dehydropantoate 2-reductase [Christensenellaceae bacterium]